MRRSHLFVVTLAACMACAVPGRAQIMTGQATPPKDRAGNWNAPTMTLDTDVASRGPTFRASVTRVELSALVVDERGQPVRDLREEEIEIYDGGRKQKLQSFAAVSRAAMPIPMDTLSAADAKATALSTNSWAGTSRLLALVIDDLHIDPRHAERARLAARRFVAQLAPSDLLFVGLTSNPEQSTTAFTRDRRRALAIIDGFGGLRLVDGTQEMRRTRAAGPDAPGLAASEQQRAMRLVDAYGTVQRVATAARAITGRRKSLVLLSQGSPVGAAAAGATSLSAEATSAMRDAVAAATAADVAVYPISPAGLDTPTDGMIEGFTRGYDEEGREVADVDLSQLVSEFLQAKNQLRDLAALTGGVALSDRNDLDAAVRRVLDDASDYYVISYEPDKTVKGTTVRPIHVRVKRPGVRVHARRGYLAPPATPAPKRPSGADVSPAMTALLSGVVPEDGIPLLVQVVPVAHVGERVRHAVIVDAAGGALVQGLDRGQVRIEQAVADVDAAGRLGNVTHQHAALKLKGDQAERVRNDWVRAVWAVDLLPGMRQIRVAVAQPGTGLTGSMYVDVTSAAAQPVDPAALVSAMASPRPTTYVDPALKDLLPAAAPEQR